ncbi:BsuPI-related putative proteinase inhibitor [Exiguobacterium sp. s193]|uniref:BsuPI-related putative proteinase inhibitor n=1 Tax=Exiguobacterium sp. s193 TaxID=2751207 RepID=UPI001BE81801|nr:BsuPI-related putative proteinase inhibitor [Exiguobacterium sp. s193]
MKKSWIHLLLIGLLLVLGGCGQVKESNSASQTNQNKSKQPITISVTAQQVTATEIEATVRLRNPNDHAVSVTYPSSQKFELVVRDSNEQNVYTYSKEQVFTQAIETEPFKPKEEKEYQITIELVEGDTAQQVEVVTVQQFEDATVPSTKATANISKANP